MDFSATRRSLEVRGYSLSEVTVGEKMPLALKLYDSRVNMTVRADVFSMFGDRLATVNLYHAESGLYLNTDLPMPDVKYVLVTYTVEDSEDYESVCERFDSSERMPEEESFVAGQVDSVSKSAEFITGVIDEVKSH